MGYFAQEWLKTNYPTTIINDRFNGSYSRGKWLAFPLDYYEVPLEVDEGDTGCESFWYKYKEPVGKGNTPQEAFDSLVEQMKEQALK